MKNRFFVIGSFFFIFSIFFSEDVLALTGRITSVKGSVLLIHPRRKAIYARVGSRVGKGTIIKTGIRSNATLIIGNTVTRISQLSRISVSRIQGGTRTRPALVRLRLQRGRLRALVKKIKGRRTSFKVRTPVAVASVRGTEVDISHGPSFGTIIRFLSGNGFFANAMNRKRSMKKGQTSRVDRASIPSSPVWEKLFQSFVHIPSLDFTKMEFDSILNINEISLDTAKEDAVKNFYYLMKKSKKTSVRINVNFP